MRRDEKPALEQLRGSRSQRRISVANAGVLSRAHELQQARIRQDGETVHPRKVRGQHVGQHATDAQGIRYALLPDEADGQRGHARRPDPSALSREHCH